MPLESTITRSIIAYLNGLEYCQAEKVQGSSSASGRADINACYYGKTLRIEVKTPDHKNTASEKQIHNLEKWSKAGAITMVVYSLDTVKKFLPLCFTRCGLFKLREKNGCISWVKIT